MSAPDRFERQLPGILEGLYLGPLPSYRDDILSQTERVRQRPGWTFPERWLPLDAISEKTTIGPPLPWRTVGIVALVILALAAGAILIAGNRQQTRLPAPFGPALNGLVAHAAGGDIHVIDPMTGDDRAIVTGPETDSRPIWSLDGTRIAFHRAIDGEIGGRLYIVRPDGSQLTRITAEAPHGLETYSFSPDGREVLFATPETGIVIAQADGSGARTIDVAMMAVDPAYRPPTGAQIVFTGSPGGPSRATGIYVMNADGTGLTELVEPAADAAAGEPRWSPDGSLIAYSLVDFTVPEWTVHTRIMAADGSGDRALPVPPGATWNYGARWSNDGSRLVLTRGYSPAGEEDAVIAVVPVDGSGTGIETERSQLAAGPTRYFWAPDDTSILATPVDAAGTPLAYMLVDPLTGETRTPAWASDGHPDWQRLATDGP